jgi:hypothetical protein
MYGLHVSIECTQFAMPVYVIKLHVMAKYEHNFE